MFLFSRDHVITPFHFQVILVEKYGRKPLLLVCYSSQTFFLILLVISIQVEDVLTVTAYVSLIASLGKHSGSQISSAHANLQYIGKYVKREYGNLKSLQTSFSCYINFGYYYYSGYLIGFSIGAGPVTLVVVAELFDQSSRPAAVSIASAIYWLGFFVSTVVTPYMLVRRICYQKRMPCVRFHHDRGRHHGDLYGDLAFAPLWLPRLP